MIPIRRYSGLLILLLLLGGAQGTAQSRYFTDSLKRKLADTENGREKIGVLLSLATYYNGQDNVLAEQYASQALEIAEMSRDRSLMINTYLLNGDRFLHMPGLTGNIERSRSNYLEAERISKTSGNDTGLVYSYCGLSQVSGLEGNNDKALSYSN